MRYNNLILLSVVCSFSSCATLINERAYNMKITSSSKVATLEYKGQTYQLPTKIKVQRSSEVLQLRVYDDSVSKELIVQPSLTRAFIFGNVFMPLYGHAIDLTNSRRYSYGKALFIHTKDTTSIIKTGLIPFYKRPMRKGVTNIILSMPYVNNFYTQPLGEATKTSTGFLGFAAGVEYVYRENHFLRLSAGTCTNFFLPFPAPVHYDSTEVNTISSMYISATNNVKLYAFTIGYGVHISKNQWVYNLYGRHVPAGTRVYAESINYSLGFAGNMYYRMGKFFNLGIVYQPSIYRLSPAPKFSYGHLLCLDLLWKIPFRKDRPDTGHFSEL